MQLLVRVVVDLVTTPHGGSKLTRLLLSMLTTCVPAPQSQQPFAVAEHFTRIFLNISVLTRTCF
jgi:hypothetical protein